MQNVTSTEKFVEDLGNVVYPITIIKFLLNRRKILSYFTKAADEDFEIRGPKYKIDNSECEACLDPERKKEGLACRQHTSIYRVLEADDVVYDVDTETYLVQNEIFKMVNGKLVIVYTPHTNLIKGTLTNSKIRKINPITIDTDEIDDLPKYQKVRTISSIQLLNQYMKCWFNKEFSIITIPNDTNYANFCLVPNA